MRCSGLPDSDTSATVVEEYKESVTISAPAGTAANWDAHIFSLPIQTSGNNDQFYVGTEVKAGVGVLATPAAGGAVVGSGAMNVFAGVGAGEAPITLNMLNVHTFATSGGNLAPVRGGAYQAPVVAATFGKVVSPGRRRLIALAFEIHDTTSQLNKQGTLTAYRMPQAPTQNTAVGDLVVDGVLQSPLATTGVTTGYLTPSVPQQYDEYNLPPSSVALAMEYEGSRQWEAKDGAYVVCTQDLSRNTLSFTKARQVAFTDGDFVIPQVVGLNATNTVEDAWFTRTQVQVGTQPSAVAVPTTALDHMDLPFHTGGVMLTGLNPLSTFTLTVRHMWEVAPVTGDAVGNGTVNPLVPLAQKSAEHDLIALGLYQRAVCELPVAVPVSENAEGDFWDWCLSAVAVAAPAIGALVPGGAQVGNYVAKAAEKYQKSRNADAALQKKAYQRLADGPADNSNFRPRVQASQRGASGVQPRGRKGPAKTPPMPGSKRSNKRERGEFNKLPEAEKKRVLAALRAINSV